MTPPGLSVILPCFNEARTLPQVLLAVARALPGVEKEVILVDDGSTDGTREWIQANFPDGPRSGTTLTLGADGSLDVTDTPDAARITIRPHFHPANRGKGAALITGMAAATGAVIVIQDADLEYDPADWTAMYNLIAHRGVADVVYGSRFLAPSRQSPYRLHDLANRFLSVAFSALYGQRLSDVEVCYKMMTATVRDSLALTCADFACEIQISAQIARPKRWRIREVPVRYAGRSYAEGKKIGWKDGVKAVACLVRFRLRDSRSPARRASSLLPRPAVPRREGSS